jgi:hypothetical protein
VGLALTQVTTAVWQHAPVAQNISVGLWRPCRKQKLGGVLWEMARITCGENYRSGILGAMKRIALHVASAPNGSVHAPPPFGNSELLWLSIPV